MQILAADTVILGNCLTVMPVIWLAYDCCKNKIAYPEPLSQYFHGKTEGALAGYILPYIQMPPPVKSGGSVFRKIIEYLYVPVHFGQIAVFNVNAGNARTYCAQQLIVYSADTFRCLGDGAPALDLAGIYRDGIAELHIGNVGNVHKRLIHADTSANRCGSAVDHNVPIARKSPVEAVSIAARDKRKPSFPRRRERSAIAYRVAWVNGFKLTYHGL